jgi:hypothetical protein
MTKTFEWNGLVVQVLEDSIEIKPKTPADLSTSQQALPQAPVQGLGSPAGIWPSEAFLDAFSTADRLWVKRVQINSDNKILEVECEETKLEPIDSKMTSFQITVHKKR